MTRRMPVAGPVAVAAALAVVALSAAQSLSERDAERMRDKLDAILERGAAPAGSRLPPMTTAIAEREINAYLRFIAAPDLPVGLVDPTITIAPGGRLSARAQVDLDAIRTSKPRGAMDPMAYVSGIVELGVAGTLEASRGRGRFSLESATLGGVPVPHSLVQELVTYYTRSPEHPQGVSLTQPFDLPVGIQQVRTTAGQATIVQ